MENGEEMGDWHILEGSNYLEGKQIKMNNNFWKGNDVDKNLVKSAIY